MRVRLDDGTRLYFDVAGESLVIDGDRAGELPTLLLLHGGPGADHTTMKPDFSALSDVAQVVYLDQRSHGRSDRRPESEWTIDVWADDIVRFCDALEIEHPIVCGTSFGAVVALHYAARHADHPRAVALLSPMARLHLDAVVETFRRLGGDDAADAARRALTDPSPENLSRYFTLCGPLYTRRPGNALASPHVILNLEVTLQWMAQQQRALDLRAELASVTAPCLVVVGADDPITPVVAAEEIRDGLTNARVDCLVLDQCGHGVYRDQPGAALVAVRRFVETVAPPTIAP